MFTRHPEMPPQPPTEKEPKQKTEEISLADIELPPARIMRLEELAALQAARKRIKEDIPEENLFERRRLEKQLEALRTDQSPTDTFLKKIQDIVDESETYPAKQYAKEKIETLLSSEQKNAERTDLLIELNDIHFDPANPLNFIKKIEDIIAKAKKLAGPINS